MSITPDTVERRLCAVFFADIVGYVSLASADEAEALEVVRLFQEVARKNIGSAGGEVVKFIGDAVLAAFGSTARAVECAIELQTEFARVTAARNRIIRLRTGVHIGDVTTAPDGDVYGDGVNAAARIQELAEPDEVLVSEDVWRQLKSHRDLAFLRLGDHRIRGGTHAIGLYAVDSAAEAEAEGGTRRRRRALKRRWKARAHKVGIATGIGAAAAVVALVLLWSLVPGRAEAEFPNRGWVVIADFQNHTADSLYTEALNTALRVALEQSTYVNVAPPQRVEGALRRMRRPVDSPLDAATAREVALRENFHAVLLPSISQVGTRFTVAVRMERPDGEHLETVTAPAEGQDELLPALDRLAVEIREYLGEARSSLQQLQQPLQQATTASLEALQQYSLGHEAQLRARFDDARWHYGEAIRLDSTFPAALTRAGALEWELGNRGTVMEEFREYDSAEGERLVRVAASHIRDVTERERLAFLPVHALIVEQDTAEAIQHLRRMLDQYPDDFAIHNNLGRLLELSGEYEAAVESYKRAVSVNPDWMPAYTGMTWLQMNFIGRVDSAIAWAQRRNARDSTYYMIWSQLGWAYVGADQLEDAVRAFRMSLQLNPDYTLVRFRLGHALRMLGRYTESIEAFREILESEDPDPAAHYDIAVPLRLAGDEEAAVMHFRHWLDQATAAPREQLDAAQLAQVAAAHLRLGDTTAARRAEAEAMSRIRGGGPSPQWKAMRRSLGFDTLGYFELAGVNAVRGDVQSTLDRLEQAERHGHTNFIWALLNPNFEDARRSPRFRGWVEERIRSGQRPASSPPTPPA